MIFLLRHYPFWGALSEDRQVLLPGRSSLAKSLHLILLVRYLPRERGVSVRIRRSSVDCRPLWCPWRQDYLHRSFDPVTSQPRSFRTLKGSLKVSLREAQYRRQRGKPKLTQLELALDCRHSLLGFLDNNPALRSRSQVLSSPAGRPLAVQP